MNPMFVYVTASSCEQALSIAADEAGHVDVHAAAAVSGLALWALGTVGSSAPFVGLFGTVAGITPLFSDDNTVFKIGYPADYGLGVDTKFQQKYRIWVDRTPDRLFVIYARCTHLGCTPDWKPSENKFKCPCHGSGYDSEGVNFEGPAPRPMDRAHVELAPDGQVIVDVSRLYQWPKGQPSHFNDPGAYLPG